ncbi:RNA 2',3'-cyclic phosphodiesterase [Stutzerimonas zhaodongensis]|uniref:RNA 2',3'-cyclic phosphodiesterase n=1 Tax=Stutzerimonas zhaodongensis TaxID=1176257 RepID=UPI0021068980|nr:RNA 2',3'-cyclic phosphodiesterase [Stutzerimonas zhaodongensis]MCQ2030048.1 RNA 2',3'-cyclic phosphodiesterase [Stutzerimonas zhaodongensis]
MASEKPLRLFFALGCPPALADNICSWRDSLPLAGRPVAKDNLHLTLAFLGSQPTTALDGLKDLGDQLRGTSFYLRLDQVQTIGNGFLCLTPGLPPPPLLQLVDNLRTGLSSLGMVPDSRPFLPHVTLAREAGMQQPHLASEAFEWRVNGYGLFRSENTESGVRYDELVHWPLAATSG